MSEEQKKQEEQKKPINIVLEIQSIKHGQKVVIKKEEVKASGQVFE